MLNEENGDFTFHPLCSWNLDGTSYKNHPEEHVFYIDKKSPGNTVENACCALQHHNELFGKESVIAYKVNNGLRIIDFTTSKEEVLNPNMLQTMLTGKPFAWYYGYHEEKVKDNDGKVFVNCVPSFGSPGINVFKSLCTLPPGMKDMIPSYNTTHPGMILTFDGDIISEHGYAEDYGIILLTDYEKPIVPNNPTLDDVKKARDTLFRAFRTFKLKPEKGKPMEEWVSFQNAVFTTFLAALRPVYDGPMPIIVVNKNSERVGGTLFLQSLGALTHSYTPSRVTFSTSSAENEKTYLAKQRQNPLFIIIDNVTHDCDWVSPSLLSATTGGKNSSIEFRPLGKTEIITVIPKSLYAVNGIRVKITADVSGRVVVIEMESSEAWQTIMFDEDKNELLQRMKNMHPEVIAALSTMIRYWISQGRPAAKESNGNISEYSELYNFIGGVMSACGYDHYLDNMHEIQTITNDKDSDGSDVVDIFYKIFNTKKVRIHEILEKLRIEVSLRKNNASYDFSNDLSPKILQDGEINKIDSMSPASIGKKLEPFVDTPFFGTNCRLHKGRDQNGVYYYITVKGETHQSTISDNQTQMDSSSNIKGTLLAFE